MKKVHIVIILSALLLGVAFITCPSADDHREALKNAISAATQEEISTGEENQSLSSMLGTFLSDGLTSILTNNMLQVQKYGIFSLGRISGHDDIITVGVFNYVFTPSKNTIREKLRDFTEFDD